MKCITKRSVSTILALAMLIGMIAFVPMTASASSFNPRGGTPSGTNFVIKKTDSSNVIKDGVIGENEYERLGVDLDEVSTYLNMIYGLAEDYQSAENMLRTMEYYMSWSDGKINVAVKTGFVGTHLAIASDSTQEIEAGANCNFWFAISHTTDNGEYQVDNWNEPGDAGTYVPVAEQDFAINNTGNGVIFEWSIPFSEICEEGTAVAGDSVFLSICSIIGSDSSSDSEGYFGISMGDFGYGIPQRYQKNHAAIELSADEIGGHNWGEWIVTIAPTCTEPGEETRTCSSCGETETMEISPLDHDWNESVTDPTCTEQGFTTHTCSRCNDSYVDTYVDALGHNWSDWTIVSSPTCENDGYSIRICGRCSETENKSLPAIGHDWNDGVVTTPATNLKDGVMTYTCSRCGETKTEVIPKTAGEPIDTTTIFTDVKEKSWFKKAVDFVYNNGLMNGMTEDTFAPNEAMSRAMLVTVLWRAEGSPAPAGATPFTDLKAKWYKDAVAWAYENEIVKGMSATTFDPNAPLSREQIAAIMYRYSEYRGADVSGRASLDGFPDGGKTHNYAKDAMSWAVYEGLISGTKAGDKVLLDPRGNATRAQVATILMRYLEG